MVLGAAHIISLLTFALRIARQDGFCYLRCRALVARSLTMNEVNGTTFFSHLWKTSKVHHHDHDRDALASALESTQSHIGRRGVHHFQGQISLKYRVNKLMMIFSLAVRFYSVKPLREASSPPRLLATL